MSRQVPGHLALRCERGTVATRNPVSVSPLAIQMAHAPSRATSNGNAPSRMATDNHDNESVVSVAFRRSRRVGLLDLGGQVMPVGTNAIAAHRVVDEGRSLSDVVATVG